LRKQVRVIFFSTKIKHLDLQYNGEFETTFHYSEDMTLEEFVERVLDAVRNQLEIDDCQYDANVLSYTSKQLFNGLHFFNDFGKKVAVSETAVFFTEADGSEGQYYIILEGILI
jgi:hypothetical protein